MSLSFLIPISFNRHHRARPGDTFSRGFAKVGTTSEKWMAATRATMTNSGEVFSSAALRLCVSPFLEAYP
jgi:hypothetical protein